MARIDTNSAAHNCLQYFLYLDERAEELRTSEIPNTRMCVCDAVENRLMNKGLWKGFSLNRSNRRGKCLIFNTGYPKD